MRWMLGVLMCLHGVAEADTFSSLRTIYWQREASLQIASAAAQAAQATQNDSRRWLNDGAALSVSQLQQNNEHSVFEQQWELTLPTLFSSAALKDTKSSDTRITNAQVLWAQINASAQLYRQIGEAKIQQQLLQNQSQRLATASALQGDITQRVQAGEAALAELIQMQIELSAAQNDLLLAQTNAQEAQLNLQEMLGQTIDLDSIVLPAATAPTQPHALLQLAEYQVQRAQAQRQWSSDWSRDIEWSLLYKQERSEVDARRENSSGIGVRVPLGRSQERRDERQQAITAYQLAQQQWQRLQQNLPLQQQRADLRKNATQQHWQQLQQMQQWQAQHFSSVERAWRQGELRFNEVLRAQQRQSQLHIELWQSHRDMINAQADWFVAYGVLP